MKSLLLLPLSVLLLVSPAWSQNSPVPAKELEATIAKGVEFLKTTQSADGTWTAPNALGITALATHALLISDVPADDPTVSAGLKHIVAAVQPDGGIYHPDSTHRNYETSISLLALEAANADGRYQQTIDQAVAFLKRLQWDEEEVGDRAHPAFGGAGYGSKSRPDLSNTSFFIEALRAAGVPSSDPAMQNALVFVSRCQNLEGPHNTTEFAAKVDDGGFYYTSAAGGSSQAGETPEGGLRSYASMTYAGLKSMIYAGVTPDDPRVKAATDWIRKFYTLEENPGMGQQGLFYYYQTFAKALDALGTEIFVDASGTRHDWRNELARHLISLQQPNGSWVNPAERWYEGDPNLVTAYTLMALQHCRVEQDQ